MKITFLTLFFVVAGLSLSCSEEKAAPAADESKSSTDLNARITELQAKVQKYEREAAVYEDPNVTGANQKMFEIDKALQDAKKNHPELKPLYEKSEDLKEKATKAVVAGNSDEQKKMMREYSAVRMELEQKAAALPELQEARAATLKAQEDYFAAIRASIAKHFPEAKPLVEELEELKKKL